MPYTPGDIVLCHGPGWISRLIRFGERMRDPASDSQWNHAAIISDEDGTIIEAVGKGVRKGSLADYPDHIIIPSRLSAQDTAQALAFAESCVGIEYGYLTDVSIGISLLVPWSVHFQSRDTLICSELVARALEHGGWICPKLDTSHVMPSDLAKWLLHP